MDWVQTDPKDPYGFMYEGPLEYFKNGKPKPRRTKRKYKSQRHSMDQVPQPITASLIKTGKITGNREIMDTLKEGIQTGFDGIEYIVSHLLGPQGLWDLSEEETNILAKAIARRADKGDEKAIKAISFVQDNMDTAKAAMIVLPRVGYTIKEVIQNGVKPNFGTSSEDD